MLLAAKGAADVDGALIDDCSGVRASGHQDSQAL